MDHVQSCPQDRQMFFAGRKESYLMGVEHESRWARWESRPVYLRDIFARLKHSIGSREIEALIARNAELRNRHKERTRCFVIGNGPSLKTQDLTLLKDEITIVANSFFKH